jgi:peptide/nickel transport system permease protein
MLTHSRDERARLFVLALETLLPLLLSVALIAILVDVLVNRIDPSELRLNTLLMGTRPIRVLGDPELFAYAVGSSAVLLAAAVGAAVAIGVPAGIVYASSRTRVVRAVAWAIGTLGSALPTFFWAVAGELALIAIFVETGRYILPPAGFGLDQHLVLPAVALGIRPAATVFRLTAIAVDEIRHQDYVRTGVAKGLRDRPLLLRHVLPNAAPTILASIVFAARGALSSLAVVEFVYVWGGAGLTFIQAVATRQAVLAAGLAITFAIGSTLLTLAAELARRRVTVAA